MRTTATQLVTYWTCPFLWHVSYEVKEPLPVWGTRRRFGNVIHAAIAEYERRGRSLERAFLLLEDQRAGLSLQDLEEARSILISRHERAPGREGRLVLVEGSLRAHLDGHRLEVRMDRAPDRWEVELLRARKVVSLPAEVDPGKLREFTRSLIQGVMEGDRESRPYDPNFCRSCPAKLYCPRWSASPKPFSKTPGAKLESQRLLF
jgi:hypothetical protein